MSGEAGTGTEPAADADAASGSVSSSIDPNSVRAVAKKDFQDSIRSWLFWGLSVFFFTLLVTVTGALAYFGEDIAAEGATTDMLVVFVSEITRLVIPLIALILGWKAIAGERETGSIKILLSLPHSRKDVLLGKLIGRSAVLSVSLVVGFTLAAVVVAAILGGFDVVDYVGLLGMSILYGIAYTSIAVALSSLTRSTTVAGAAMVGVFVTFYIVWNALETAFELLARREVLFFETTTYTVDIQGEEVPVERLPDWMLFVLNLDPGEAYARALSLATDTGAIQFQVQIEEAMFDGSVPFSLQDWFAFSILLFWIVVPIAVALYRFDRVDL